MQFVEIAFQSAVFSGWDLCGVCTPRNLSKNASSIVCCFRWWVSLRCSIAFFTLTLQRETTISWIGETDTVCFFRKSHGDVEVRVLCFSRAFVVEQTIIVDLHAPRTLTVFRCLHSTVVLRCRCAVLPAAISVEGKGILLWYCRSSGGHLMTKESTRSTSAQNSRDISEAEYSIHSVTSDTCR